jgi:SSS family solute:Na+ symporter
MVYCILCQLEKFHLQLNNPNMHTIDYIIFVVYMIAMLAVGLYFFNKKQNSRRFLRKWTEYEQLAYWFIGCSH